MSSGPLSQHCTRCRRSNVWRIQLRQCEHLVCVACALLHLQYWIAEKNKARIKCPKRDCPIRIHENDIDALLDVRNDDLNVYIPLAEREWLLYEHRKNTIQYAFDGNVKQCPLCKSIYTEYDGCHYVQCVNLRCMQHFCWQCGQPINSFQHFTTGICKVGWDDIWKLSYLFRFLFYTEGCILMIIVPLILPAMSCFLPIIITLLFPYYCTCLLRRKLREANSIPLLITAAVALSYPILLFIGLPLAIGSFMFIIPAQLLIAFVVAVKNIPIVSKIFNIIYCAEMIAGCLGLDNWRTLLRDSKEARRLKEIELKQQELEKSERQAEEGGNDGGESSAAGGSTSAPQNADSSSSAVDKVKETLRNLPIIGGIVGNLPGMK